MLYIERLSRARSFSQARPYHHAQVDGAHQVPGEFRICALFLAGAASFHVVRIAWERLSENVSISIDYSDVITVTVYKSSFGK